MTSKTLPDAADPTTMTPKETLLAAAARLDQLALDAAADAVVYKERAQQAEQAADSFRGTAREVAKAAADTRKKAAQYRAAAARLP